MNTIPCPLHQNATTLSKIKAIITAEQTLTWAQLNDHVNEAITYFKNTDLQKGERVGILNESPLDTIIAVFALWKMGAVTCLLNTRLPKEHIQKQLDSINCHRFFVPENFVCKEFSLTPEIIDTISLDQNATIIFTSGSTDEPKAALHTYGNHYYSAQGANKHIPFQAQDRWLLSLPLYHVGGLSILFRSLIDGGTMVIPSEDENIYAVMDKYQITHISLVPTQLQRLLKNKNICSSLKAVLVGGAPIPKNLIQQAEKNNLPVYITYGLTEMASQVATSNRQSNRAEVLEHRQVSISEKGEVYVRGKTLFKGYIQNNSINLPIHSEGWFATGDLGELTEEGYLDVLGRTDNMFISGGENIQPEEIEKYLCQIQGIKQAVVVSTSNKEFGFRPIAFIKMEEGRGINQEKVIISLQKKLPKYKCPDQILPWPKNISKSLKINRRIFQKSIPKNLISPH